MTQETRKAQALLNKILHVLGVNDLHINSRGLLELYIREALSPAPDKWQPISTAPVMTAVLVYGNGYEIAHFHTQFQHFVTCFDHSVFKATHWMPLPPPPQEEIK